MPSSPSKTVFPETIIFFFLFLNIEGVCLDNIIHIDNHIVISNLSQRAGTGGRLALIVDNTKYTVHILTKSKIVIP